MVWLQFRSVLVFGLDFPRRPSGLSLDHRRIDDRRQRPRPWRPEPGQDGEPNIGHVCQKPGRYYAFSNIRIILLVPCLIIQISYSGRHVHRDLPALFGRAWHQLPRPVQSARPSLDDVVAVHSHPRPCRLHFRGLQIKNDANFFVSFSHNRSNFDPPIFNLGSHRFRFCCWRSCPSSALCPSRIRLASGPSISVRLLSARPSSGRSDSLWVSFQVRFTSFIFYFYFSKKNYMAADR